jgi:trehalose 6-phosphate synthase
VAPPLLLVSNRGPLSWRTTDGGDLVPRRGGGGLVSGLAPLLDGTDGIWLASALSPGDRLAAAAGRKQADGLNVELIAHDPDVLHQAYDVVGNGVLWYLHHGLYELSRRPRFDRVFATAWEGYRSYNRAFAEAVLRTAKPGATVLIQDYHLSLVPPLVRAQRDDLRLVHFAHTPFAGPDWLGVLPDPYRAELLAGLAAATACTFHTARWRDAFLACCAAFGVDPPATALSPLGPDAADLEQVARSEACAAALAELNDVVGDRALVVRVDRIELSKNLLRGFWAFDELLETHPEWRERVCFAALVYPSREGLADYLAYRSETEHLVHVINRKWATPSWTPILLEPRDDFPRSVAALRRFDALLVNPIRDGMNLVAKEGPLVNERDGVVVLSTEAGAWDELGDLVEGVNPYDVSGTAEALHRALSQDLSIRRARREALVGRVRANGSSQWLAAQLAAAGATG